MTTVETKFYEFRQNNSGGSFDYDEQRGISVSVIVEAVNSAEAVDKALEIGLYFNGEGDCECCGDRWYEPWRDDGKDEPSVYDTPVAPGDTFVAENFNIKWMKKGRFEGFIHYYDGRVEGFWA